MRTTINLAPKNRSYWSDPVVRILAGGLIVLSVIIFYMIFFTDAMAPEEFTVVAVNGRDAIVERDGGQRIGAVNAFSDLEVGDHVAIDWGIDGAPNYITEVVE